MWATRAASSAKLAMCGRRGQRRPQSLLCVGDEGSVVRKEKEPDWPFLGLGVGLYAPQIDETAIHTVD